MSLSMNTRRALLGRKSYVYYNTRIYARTHYAFCFSLGDFFLHFFPFFLSFSFYSFFISLYHPCVHNFYLSFPLPFLKTCALFLLTVFKERKRVFFTNYWTTAYNLINFSFWNKSDLAVFFLFFLLICSSAHSSVSRMNGVDDARDLQHTISR